MSDIKISAMPAATTPLTGSEILPIVQGGANDQVTVANLTSGRVPSAAGFITESTSIISEPNASRTLSAADNGKIIWCTGATTVTITTAVSLGKGFSCMVYQGGAGQVTFAQGASTTLASYGAQYKTMGQYAAVLVFAPVADTFVLAGNTTT